MSEETPSRDIANAILTRRYELDDGHVDIYVWAPVQPDDDYVRCDWQIIGLGEENLRTCRGVDTADGVTEALKVISVRLYSSKEWRGGRLTWLGMRDLGLPCLPGDRPLDGGYGQAQLLTTAGWQMVVQVPEEPMPHIAWSDEHFASLIRNLKAVLRDVDNAPEKARPLLAHIVDGLLGEKRHYEGVCREAGLPPPPAGHDQ